MLPTPFNSSKAYAFRTFDDAIDAALYLEKSDFMRAVVIFRLSTSLIAWVAMTSVYGSIRYMRAHRGLVLLLHIHYFWAHAFCSCAIFDAFCGMYKSATWVEPEDLLNSGLFCYIRKVPYGGTLIGGSVSFLNIVIERRQASLHVQTYEGTGIKQAVQLTAFLALYLMVYLVGATLLFEFDLIYAHCVGVTPKSEAFMSTFALTILGILLVAIVVFRRLLNINKQFGKMDKESLSERYQIKENIRTLKLLVPLVDTQFILNFAPILMWLLYSSIPHGFDSRAYPIFEECINFVQLYGIVMPLLVIRNQRRDQERIRKELSTNKSSRATDNHLKKIQLNW